uniref:Uncharacterized protein n=1 Tax=Arundo donax TaxID=35708 RepID=A0A0A9E781_ARUDO
MESCLVLDSSVASAVVVICKKTSRCAISIAPGSSSRSSPLPV